MKVTCAISGIRFATSYLDTISIDNTLGFYHPIFSLPNKTLYQLYYQHSQNNLNDTDSYLLFMAFLYSSGKIAFVHPATPKPTESSTKKLIQNNISQLIKILEKTAVIKHPAFKQPSFKITYDNSSLEQIPNWIAAWEDNIDMFNNSLSDINTQRSLQEIENRLGDLICTGVEPEKFAATVAKWASQAADFPPHKDTQWQEVIRSCFNATKMFNTPLPVIKEIKDYCECNIQAGSVHFHTLCEVLKEGIFRHVNYLGGSSLALGYTILPSLDATADREMREKEQVGIAALKVISDNAPLKEPTRLEYPDLADYIKARLAYRVARIEAAKNLSAPKPQDKKEPDL